MWTLMFLAGAASAAPVDEVVSSLQSLTDAVARGDTAETRRWLHPQAIQVVHMGGNEVAMTVDDYVGAMEAGRVGGQPIALHVSGIQVEGAVATAQTVRTVGEFRLADAVTLSHDGERWRVVSMAVVAGAVE